MKIEFTTNIIDDRYYWFDLGISVSPTYFNKYKYVFSLALTFWTIYIRW